MICEKLKDINYLNEKISELKKENNSADIQLLEKTVGALGLVELLSLNNVDFIFKGGTSLILLLDDIKRFSVDVDILTDMDEKTLEEVFEQIVESSNVFKGFDIDERNNESSKRMKLKHYRFYFDSVQDGSEKYVLLDVAFETNLYSKTIKKKITCKKLDIESKIEVKLPSPESVLGDKLNVLGPNTTGISLDSHKDLECIKQLYDVSNLFDTITSVEDVRESFIKISTRELAYRKLDSLTYEDVLADIEKYLLDIIYLKSMEWINKLAGGLRKGKSYLLVKNYVLEIDGALAASKILYLISLIRNDGKLERYIPEEFNDMDFDLSSIDQTKHRRLKFIKKSNKEALFYLLKYENYNKVM